MTCSSLPHPPCVRAHRNARMAPPSHPSYIVVRPGVRSLERRPARALPTLSRLAAFPLCRDISVGDNPGLLFIVNAHALKLPLDSGARKIKLIFCSTGGPRHWQVPHRRLTGGGSVCRHWRHRGRPTWRQASAPLLCAGHLSRQVRALGTLTRKDSATLFTEEFRTEWEEVN